MKKKCRVRLCIPGLARQFFVILPSWVFQPSCCVRSLISEFELLNTKTIEFMFAGINMFWARLRLILARAVRRGLKWALRRAQNIFVPANLNSVTIIITLEGIERINTEKMTTKRSEEYFFNQRCKETSTNFEMASRFWLAAYIVWLFDSHFSLVHVSGLKYILARQILHFSP